MAQYKSVYPPAHNDTYVKAGSKYDTSYWPYFATDPAKSLTGAAVNNQWDTANMGGAAAVRFHIDLGGPQLIRRIYYENRHNSGGSTNNGAKTFTFWGSNVAAAFAELTYGTDTNWTSIPVLSNTFIEHTGSDVADPQYILANPTAPFRYYAIKISEGYIVNYAGFRRIELQMVRRPIIISF